MTKEEILIAQAAYCVGKIWDEYEGTEDFERLVGKRVQHVIELVRNYKPSLPSDLDEAAENYYENECPYDGEARVVNREHDVWFPSQAIEDAFKAGAEWMAGQGVTDMVYGTVCGRVRDHINVKFADGIGELLVPKSISHIPADVSKYNVGDKVKIQILKK